MAIKRSGGGWMYDIRHPVTKKRRRVGGFRTKSDAENAVAVLKNKWMSERHQIPNSRKGRGINLVEAVLAECADLRAGHTGYDTVERLRNALVGERFARVISNELSASDLNRSHIEIIIESELARGVCRQSVLTDLTRFKAVLRRVKERHANELSDWEIPNCRVRVDTKSRRDRIISPEEVDLMISVLRNPREYLTGRYSPKTEANWRDAADLFEIAVETGMRRGEIYMLRTKIDIDLRGGIIHARTLKKRGRNKLQVRDIPMTRRVKSVIEHRASDGISDSEFLFPRYRSNKSGVYINTAFRQAAKLSSVNYGNGGDGFVLHSSRHTAASVMIQNGTDLTTVSSILGNSVEVLMRTYSHTTNESKARAVGHLSRRGEL